jgi:type VI secretion system secreted protein VgrG
MPFTHEERQVQLFTSLGDDVLYLDRFHGREELSRLFRFDLGLWSEDLEIDFDEIVGRPLTVAVDRVGAGPRFFNGFVSHFEHVMDLGDVAYYKAEVVPWLWFLTRTADCRIFQEMSAPDIVLEIIKEHGFTDFEVNFSETYEPLEYCTQYRETDFNFVSRLMEEFGIHYHFRHEADRHVMKIGDSLNSYEHVGGLEKIPFDPATEDNRPENSIWRWTWGRRVQPFKVEIRDFDYDAPKEPVVSTEAGDARNHEHGSYEIQESPTRTTCSRGSARRSSIRRSNARMP